MSEQILGDILFEAAGGGAAPPQHNAGLPPPPPHNHPHPPGLPDHANAADSISPAALTHRLMDDKQHLTWSRVALPPGSVVPPRRSGAASVVVKGKLYMFGVSLESVCCIS